ncbi:MAG TPA: cohesin domain-containing protein [Patescibacteria group bacterium]|nr:cohesin domain-containing protein [Patescibacteria group bacterium]
MNKKVLHLKIFSVFLVSLFLLSFSEIHAANPEFYLDPASASLKKYDVIDISVMINTDGENSLGAGAKLFFNSNLLKVVAIDASDIYDDFPSVFFNNDTGSVTVSGVVNSPDKPYNGKGELAKIKFQAIKEGNAKVWFYFEPGSTVDSNIAVSQGTGDILSRVSNFSGYIYQNTDPKANDTLLITPTENSTGGSDSVDETSLTEGIDAEGPLPSLNPKTNPDTNQPAGERVYTSTSGIFNPNNKLVIIGGSILVLLILVIAFIIARKKDKSKPNKPININYP